VQLSIREALAVAGELLTCTTHQTAPWMEERAEFQAP